MIGRGNAKLYFPNVIYAVMQLMQLLLFQCIRCPSELGTVLTVEHWFSIQTHAEWRPRATINCSIAPLLCCSFATRSWKDPATKAKSVPHMDKRLPRRDIIRKIQLCFVHQGIKIYFIVELLIDAPDRLFPFVDYCGICATTKILHFGLQTTEYCSE